MDEADLLSEAKRLREEGLSWPAIDQRLGKKRGWIRRRIDPVFAEKGRMAGRSHYDKYGKKYTEPLTAEELEERIALIPTQEDDTRDLTGRLMGDPIPNDPRRQNVS